MNYRFPRILMNMLIAPLALVMVSLTVSCASVENKSREAVRLGDQLLAERKCAQAMQEYARAAELTPGSANLHLKMARAHARCGASMAAIKEYKTAMSHGASELEVYREIAPLLFRMGESRGAENIYRKIVKLAPSDCVAYNNLGVVLRRQKKHSDARKAFENAIKANPSHSDSYLNLALLLENELNDLAKATKYYKKYLSLASDAPNASKIKNRIIQNELKLLEQGHSISDFDERMEQGEKQLAEGSFEDAEASFRAALRARPTSSTAQIKLGVALMEQGKLREAKSVLEKCLKARGGSAECAYQLGWAHKLGGSNKKAIDLWKKALRIDPSFKKAKRTLNLYDK